MPTKKSTTSNPTVSKAAKPAPPKAAPAAQKDHKHAALEASIAALKEEVASLKGQCHSCCAALDELKAQAGKSQNSDLARLISILNHAPTYAAFRKKVRSS